ncbi:hypothetical protein [Actinomyces lilanjuaniae]|nr:hypothetical protein [Actinomyces lilanjuaniae]
MTFPTSGTCEAVNGPYGRWWSPNATFADDPDRTRYSYLPLSGMKVHDDASHVVLVGCRAAGGARQTHIAGKGVFVVDYASRRGRSLKYGQVNGMRTTSSAYRNWVGRSSIEIFCESDSSGRLQSATLSLKQTDSIKISDRLNMSACHDWRAAPVLDGYDVRESLSFQSLVKEPRKRRDHLEAHVGALDLVSIAAWKNFTFQEVHANRKENKINTPEGEQWTEVFSHLLPRDDLSNCRRRFLFSCNDMTPGGIDEWFRLRQEYGRALGYLFRALRSERTWPPQSAIMSSTPLEQVGYLIEDNDNGGSHLNDRGQLKFKDALGVILDNMEALPFS